MPPDLNLPSFHRSRIREALTERVTGMCGAYSREPGGHKCYFLGAELFMGTMSHVLAIAMRLIEGEEQGNKAIMRG